MSSRTPSAALAEYKQQRITREEQRADQRKEGANCLRYIGILMLFSALGLVVASSLFMMYTQKSENLHFGSIPIGLFASALGLIGGLCGYCSSRSIAESEVKGCAKAMLTGNFILAFVAVSQCVIASAFAGTTYSTCTENPGRAPDLDSWFSLDFRQCVTYRSEVKTAAVFLILFAVLLFVMCILSIVNFCRFKNAFGVYNQAQLLQKVEEDINGVQYIMNIQAQYPPQSGCSIQELQEIQLLITSAQEKLTEAASIPTRRNVGLPILLMNHQAKLTALQQNLNTQMQMLGRPQQPVYPFQPEVRGQSYVVPTAPYYQDQSSHHYGHSHEGQPMLNPQEGQGHPVYYYPQGGHHPQPQGQPYPASQPYPAPASQPYPTSQPYPASQPPPAYDAVMDKERLRDTQQEKNFV